jgi:hypothetical protein
MYGLPQAGILANQLLTKRLEPQGYYQYRHTPGLWRHKWRSILFSLVVDDFGVKYVGREHVDHLIASVEPHYTNCSTPYRWNEPVYGTNPQLTSLKTFCSLYLKVHINFVAGLGSWLDLSSHWGHSLPSSSH